MRIVIQRVSHASVTIDGVCKSAIEKGLMILVGIEEADNQRRCRFGYVKKVIGFESILMMKNGVMNKSILEAEGNIFGYQPIYIISPPTRRAIAPLTSVLHDRKQLFPYMNTSAMNSVSLLDAKWVQENSEPT